MLSTPRPLSTPRKRLPQQPQKPAGGGIDNLDLSFLSHGGGSTQAPTGPGPAAAAANSGGVDSLDLDFLSGPTTSPAQATPSSTQLPMVSESYKDAIRDAARANNVPVDLLLQALSGGKIPGGADLDSLNMRGLVKNGIVGIYHTANLMAHVLDKVGRNPAGYAKALNEYNNEVSQRLASDRFAPTTLGYLSRLHKTARLSSPSPEVEYANHMNAAYASDGHPEFPYPSKRPVPAAAAHGMNLLDFHRTLQGAVKFLDDVSTGAIIDILLGQTPTQPKIEATEQALKALPAKAAEAEARGADAIMQDTGWGLREAAAGLVRVYALSKGLYDDVIADVLGRSSAAGAKFVEGLTEGRGISGSLKNGLHTFAHSESSEENQADVDKLESRLEEQLFKINVKAYERQLGHVPSAKELEEAGIEYDDPTKWGPLHKFAADFLVRTLVDPLTYTPVRWITGLFRGAEYATKFLSILLVGTKRMQRLGIDPEVFTRFTGSAGEMVHRALGNAFAILGSFKDLRRLAKLIEETAPRLAHLSNKAAEFEDQAAKIKDTDPQRAEALLKRAERHRQAILRPYKASQIAKQVEISKNLLMNAANFVSAKWKAQVGVAKWGAVRGFDWLEPYGLAKQSKANALSEEQQLKTWVALHLDEAFQGLDFSGEKARELFKALNGGAYKLDDAVLNRRMQIYREAMDSIGWLYGDKYARQDLQVLGFELPEELKNLDRGPQNLMTSPDAIRAARAGEIEDPEEAAAILKRAVWRPNYIPFKHIVSSTLRLTPEEAEEVFLSHGYEAVTGVVIHSKNLLDEVRDWFLEDRPDLSIYPPEVHAAQSYARGAVAARVLATRHLAEDAEKIARQYGIPPTDPAWVDIFTETSKPIPIKASMKKGGPARLVQEQRLFETERESPLKEGFKQFMNLPLVRMFYNPSGHVSNMGHLALLNRPQLIPRVIELYLRQLYPDLGRPLVKVAQRFVKPESRVGKKLEGLAARFQQGRYYSPKLRKFVDVYATMGRFNGIKDFVSAREYTVAKTMKDLAELAEKNIKLLGIGKGAGYILRGISGFLNASSMALWPFDEALKSALMEHYVEDLKLPLGRAYARVMAETVDYSDPSNWAKFSRYFGWFATWRTKLPTVIFRLFIQNPRLFVLLNRLDPWMFGQTYEHNDTEVEQYTPVVEAFHDPLGYPTVPPTIKLLDAIWHLSSTGSDPYPEPPGQDFLESLGLPPEWARKALGVPLYSEGESAKDIFLREAILKEYTAPSGDLEKYVDEQIILQELGQYVNFRPKTLRMPKR